jgi:hypothetical protein
MAMGENLGLGEVTGGSLRSSISIFLT